MHVFEQAADLEILKQSSRLVHYCATPLLFDPTFRKQIVEEHVNPSPAKVPPHIQPVPKHCGSQRVVL